MRCEQLSNIVFDCDPPRITQFKMSASKSLAPLFATIKQLIEQSRNHVAVSVNAEEYGNDFAFLSRQKRIRIDDGDFTIDLLFYHRKLKRLIDMELKSDKFRHEYKSQSEHYLRCWTPMKNKKGKKRR